MEEAEAAERLLDLSSRTIPHRNDRSTRRALERIESRALVRGAHQPSGDNNDRAKAAEPASALPSSGSKANSRLQ